MRAEEPPARQVEGNGTVEKKKKKKRKQAVDLSAAAVRAIPPPPPIKRSGTAPHRPHVLNLPVALADASGDAESSWSVSGGRRTADMLLRMR